MRVGIAIQNNFPVDNEVRTRRIAKSLDGRGAEVSIFARNSMHHPAQGRVRETHDPPTESIGYATIHRFSLGVSTPLYSLLSVSLPFNPIWFLWMVVQFYREDPDVVIATNIRAGPPAIVAAKLLGIPIVIDLRENFEVLAELLPKNGIGDHISQFPPLIRLLEQFVISHADQVWVVVEERKEALSAAGVDPSKLVVVSNTPDLSEMLTPEEMADETVPAHAADAEDHSQFRVIYLGAVSEHRGLQRVIEAMQHVSEQDKDVQLVIGGDGPYLSELERQSRDLGVDDHVTFEGWIDSPDVPAFLKTGDVGVIPHEMNEFTQTTIPNKLFDYMSIGLPILTTDAAPVTRIVNRTDCGYVLSAEPTSRDIAEGILHLKEMNETDLQTMGTNGYRAVRSRYNWSHEEEQMMESLRRLQNGAAPETDRRPAREASL